MLRIIMFSVLVAVSGASLAQVPTVSGTGVVTSISPQGRELIVDQEIYLVPEQVWLDGVLIGRSKVASLLRPGDEVRVELESGRTVRAIHSRLR